MKKRLKLNGGPSRYQVLVVVLAAVCAAACGRSTQRARNSDVVQNVESYLRRADRISNWFQAIQTVYDETGRIPGQSMEKTVRAEAMTGGEDRPLPTDKYEWTVGTEYVYENGAPNGTGRSRLRKILIKQYVPNAAPISSDFEIVLDIDPIRWDPMYEGVAEADAKMHLDTSPSNLSKVVACAVWKESQKAKRWITQSDLLRADEEYREADDEQLLVGFSARIEKMFKGKRAWFEKNDKGGWIVVRNSSTGIEYWFPDDGPETKRIAVTMTPDGKRVRLR